MSNERIDLTQFERLPKKMEIKWHEHPLYGARYLVQISEPKTPWAVGSIAPDYEPHGVYAKDKIEQEKMAKMFAKTPDLIAELKKCYAREDELLDALQVIKEDLETGIAQGNIPINATNGIDLTKIRNFANDAAL
jgi:hypothetical protein